MRRVNNKILVFLVLITISTSCKKGLTDQKDIYYRVVNTVIQDHQNRFKGSLIVGDQDTVNFRSFDLSITPYEKFKFSAENGKTILQFSNTFRQLHLASFPSIGLEENYNYSKDSTLIVKWDSTKITNCKTIEFERESNYKNLFDHFSLAIKYRSQNDVLLVSHPLFNIEKDTATVASVLFTENYTIQSFTDVAISDTIITAFFKTRFLNRIKTETKYLENSRREEIMALIYRGSWYE